MRPSKNIGIDAANFPILEGEMSHVPTEDTEILIKLDKTSKSVWFLEIAITMQLLLSSIY